MVKLCLLEVTKSIIAKIHGTLIEPKLTYGLNHNNVKQNTKDGFISLPHAKKV